MHSSKGLEFPLVSIPGLGEQPRQDDDVEDEARLLYVAMTRATHELVMTHSDTSPLSEKIARAMGTLQGM